MPEPFLSLVGAGPGDPEMITLKAIRTLQRADAVLYDALVNPELLAYVPAQAYTRFVGKRYGCHALSQQEINGLIVSCAREYGHVVRLKGGDPFVFGRAMEEVETAREAGIPVQVVPGISSALAVAASRMIPLTARGTAESFWVTTGTTRSGSISEDVFLAARSTATMVILMAMSRLEAIMEIFSNAGKGEVPVAIIQNGTTSQQKMITGTVADIAARAQAEGIGNPAVIIVGEVVRMRAAMENMIYTAVTYEEKQAGL